MPLYEYQCSDCGHRLEALQKMSDDRLVYCPECNEPSLKKLISAAAFHLKGTGWYETDFKNSGKKDDSKADGQSDGKANDKKSSGDDKSAKSGKDGDSGSSSKASSDSKSSSSKSTESKSTGASA